MNIEVLFELIEEIIKAGGSFAIAFNRETRSVEVAGHFSGRELTFSFSARENHYKVADAFVQYLLFQVPELGAIIERIMAKNQYTKPTSEPMGYMDYMQMQIPKRFSQEAMARQQFNAFIPKSARKS